MDFENVVDFDRYRTNQKQKRLTLKIPGQVANSGSRPFLGWASDDQSYWCKRVRSDHGVEAVVNEIAAALIGDAIGAPVRPWAIIEVPSVLVGERLTDRGYALDGLPLFGSLNLHTSDVTENPSVIAHVNDDSNDHRLPRLIALWCLCNAEDIQYMFDRAEEFTVWSVDHGFWFGSLEKAWGFGNPDQSYGRPDIPALRTPIGTHHWDQAIEAVEKVDIELINDLHNAVPEEWGVEADALNRLISYAVERKSYTQDTLAELRDRSIRSSRR